MDSIEMLQFIPNYSVSELRLVRMYLKGNHIPTDHLMHQSQVDLFLKATLELHYQPGINPYNKLKTAELWYATVASVRGSNDWWWTKANLGIDKTAQGAAISYWREERVWTHPELAAKELADHLEDMRIEAEG